MLFKLAAPLALVLVPLVACGDSGASSAGATDTTQSPTADPTTSSTSAAPTTSATEGDSSGSASQTAGQTTEDPTSTTSTTSTTGTTSETAGATEVSTMPVLSTSTGDTTGTTGPDTTSTTTGNDTDCGGGGVLQFSHIWISNSPEGTVSKIDTETLVEVGRYRTGLASDPSRTSVNLKGDVAVVNRDGSITKIGAIDDHCKDTNGMPGIQTSTGPLDVKAYGQDDCVLWNTPLMPASRPAAWTSGDKVNPDDPCSELVDEKVWTSAPIGGDAIVYLLDGETGQVEGQVQVPGANGGLGIYGGAVDSNNDFWGVTYSSGPLVHVTFGTLQAETIALPDFSGGAYGFTVDAKGRSWVGGWEGSLIRYDPADQSWVKVNIPLQHNVLSRGMMEDENGHLWVAALGNPSGLLRVDTDTATFIEFIGNAVLPGVDTPTGASVDVQGQVWLVDQYKDGGGAFVYDPLAQSAQWFGGLNGPYTYSDMTGFALKNVAPQ